MSDLVATTGRHGHKAIAVHCLYHPSVNKRQARIQSPRTLRFAGIKLEYKFWNFGTLQVTPCFISGNILGPYSEFRHVPEQWVRQEALWLWDTINSMFPLYLLDSDYVTVPTHQTIDETWAWSHLSFWRRMVSKMLPLLSPPMHRL